MSGINPTSFFQNCYSMVTDFQHNLEQRIRTILEDSYLNLNDSLENLLNLMQELPRYPGLQRLYQNQLQSRIDYFIALCNQEALPPAEEKNKEKNVEEKKEENFNSLARQQHLERTHYHPTTYTSTQTQTSQTPPPALSRPTSEQNFEEELEVTIDFYYNLGEMDGVDMPVQLSYLRSLKEKLSSFPNLERKYSDELESMIDELSGSIRQKEIEQTTETFNRLAKEAEDEGKCTAFLTTALSYYEQTINGQKSLELTHRLLVMVRGKIDLHPPLFGYREVLDEMIASLSVSHPRTENEAEDQLRASTSKRPREPGSEGTEEPNPKRTKS